MIDSEGLGCGEFVKRFQTPLSAMARFLEAARPHAEQLHRASPKLVTFGRRKPERVGGTFRDFGVRRYSSNANPAFAFRVSRWSDTMVSTLRKMNGVAAPGETIVDREACRIQLSERCDGADRQA
jgi:hypothetical protein